MNRKSKPSSTRSAYQPIETCSFKPLNEYTTPELQALRKKTRHLDAAPTYPFHLPPKAILSVLSQRESLNEPFPIHSRRGNSARRDRRKIVSRPNAFEPRIEEHPSASSSGKQENGWDQFMLCAAVLAAYYFIFGTFYYKVLCLSILAVWVYPVVIRGTIASLPREQHLSLGERFRSWALDFVKILVYLLLIIWCIILSPFHAFVRTPMDAWVQYSDHPSFRPFNILHDPGKSGTVEVFAIHGLGSDSSSAWRYNDNGTEVSWLSDLLPKQSGLENIKVTILNHQTRWDSHSPEVEFDTYAKMMLDDIEHVHQQNRPVIFIAHSFGGLLLKRILVLAKTRSKHISQATRGILFLGVPHYGTTKALFASLLSCTAYWRGSSTAMLDYMSERNPAIKSLDEDFYEAYAQSRQINGYSVPYICNFLEMRPEKYGKLSLGPTVSTKSGKLQYAENVYLDTNHRGLNKFKSSTDPNFEKFLRHFHLALRQNNAQKGSQ